MKNINIILEDMEYMKLVEQKGNITWKAFIFKLLKEARNK